MTRLAQRQVLDLHLHVGATTLTLATLEEAHPVGETGIHGPAHRAELDIEVRGLDGHVLDGNCVGHMDLRGLGQRGRFVATLPKIQASRRDNRDDEERGDSQNTASPHISPGFVARAGHHCSGFGGGTTSAPVTPPCSSGRLLGWGTPPARV